MRTCLASRFWSRHLPNAPFTLRAHTRVFARTRVRVNRTQWPTAFTQYARTRESARSVNGPLVRNIEAGISAGGANVYLGWSDVTALWSQYDLHLGGQHVVLCVVKRWRSVALFQQIWISRFKKMSVLSLSYWKSDVTITYIQQSLPLKMAENSWHRHMKKLRHCHPVYWSQIFNVHFYQKMDSSKFFVHHWAEIHAVQKLKYRSYKSGWVSE